MTVVPATEPVLATVLVGLPRAHREDAAARNLPVEPFIADLLTSGPGCIRVRSRVTGEVHDLPPVYVLTPVIPISG